MTNHEAQYIRPVPELIHHDRLRPASAASTIEARLRDHRAVAAEVASSASLTASYREDSAEALAAAQWALALSA